MSNLIFFLGIFLISLLPPMDPDLGWQLKCGEIILKGQGLCSLNQFSSLLTNYQWTNHYWLYQTILFFVWKNFGLWGLSVFGAIIVTLIFSAFNLIVKNWQLEKKLAVVLILYLGWGVFLFGIRSQVLGILYFTLVLLSLLRKELLPHQYLPLIFLLWANTHGSVVLGLVLLLLFFLSQLSLQTFRHPEFISGSLILALCFLATLINPFGIKIFQEAWRHFHVVHLEKLIAEWVPPQALKISFILLAGILLVFLSRLALWPLIISFTFLGFKARRNLPFFFILFFILLLENKSFKNWLSFWLKKKLVRKDLNLIISLLILSYSLLIQLPKTFKINSSWENYCQASSLSYPQKAIEFLKAQPDKSLPDGKAGNLFNRYEWGGFLIWQLPEYKVFVDGRMPAWPVPLDASQGGTISPYTIYLETLQTKPGWQKTLENYNINWILISPGTFMDLKLKPNPQEFGWQEVYRDKISVVYKRAN